ncbi:hypothetical protein SSTU70S_00035 [Stutzerimonas stutzeri]
MRDLMAELKELRLHGMATAWAELTAQGESNTASSKWLLEHLLEQEHTDRAMRSVSHQMNMAKLPMHRDLASFDFNASSPHFSQPCALGRFDGRRSSQVAQAADSADFGQAPASALEQGACGRVDGV